MRVRLPLLALALIAVAARAADDRPAGLRVYTCGHSFHVFVPALLTEMAKGAGIKGHKMAGLSSIGGSRVIQHWDKDGDLNKPKAALTTGEIDVLTLSPIYPPDAGIENFAALALKHNPKIRVTIQQNWLPFDTYDTTFKKRPKTVDHDAPTAADLKEMHDKYLKSLDEVAAAVNKKLGKEVMFVVPVGQAVVALRKLIIDGKAPGLKKQSDLFTDAIGHATPPLRVLVGYCHYAAVYRTSPVGLPVPSALAGARIEDKEKLNRLLQELAWEAVTSHPLSGVKKPKG